MDSIQMNHAKVWLTKSRLAVGSWNLTESALNISSDAGACNVEAGIITPIDTNTYEELQPNKPLDFKKIDFIAEEELDRDRRFLMDSLPFQIQVYIDWSHDRYEISLDGEAHGSVYTIRLPGIDENHKLAFAKTNQRISIVKIQRALKEHIYTVFQRRGGVDEERYRGMIIDLETGNRPVWRYSSFNELLYAWAQAPRGVDSVNQNADSYELAYVDSIDHQFNDDETNDTPVQPSIDITFSYFTMFCAFENIRERLLSDKMDSAEKLKIMLKTQPGSLFEISDKVQKLISDPQVSGVYKWFVQEEINSMLRSVLSKLKTLGDDSLSDAINKKLVRAIEDRSLFDRFADRDKKWIQHIKKVSEYGSVR